VRVLLVSVGDQVLREPASGVAARLASYAALAGEIDQVVYSPASHGLRPTRLGPGLRSYPTRSRAKLGFFVDGVVVASHLLVRDRYDVIETQDPVAAGLVGATLAERFGVPLVVGCHNDFFGSRAWLAETPRNVVEYAVARWIVARADGVRVVSEALAESVRRLGVPPARIGVAPVPIDQGLYDRGRALTPTRRGWPATRQSASGEPARLLFVGRVVPQKDLPTLLRAVARVRRAGRDLVLDVVGTGSRLDECRALAGDLGIGDVVRFAGGLPPAELSEFLWRCDVFVSPAVYEGYGRVLAEAALHGAPTIATRVGGVTDIVADGETGLLVDPGDDAALAAAMLRLLDDPATRQAIGERAWRRAIEEFRPDRQARRVVDLWQRVAAGTLR
jgi:glycosyltransferase involved in cell wall biosynthesis